MNDIKNRAESLARQWAEDGDRLKCALGQSMTDEQWSEICGHLAKCFIALTDDSTREQAKLLLLTEVGHIHSIVTEVIFAPVAERMLRISEGGTMREAA